MKKVIENLDISDYHYKDSFKDHHGSTSVKAAKKSLKHFKINVDSKEAGERKSHFDFGNAAECALIDSENFYNSVSVMDESLRPVPEKDYRTKVNAAWKELFLLENKDKYIIAKTGSESLDTINEMLRSARDNKFLTKLLEKGLFQPSFFWVDGFVKLKARPDFCIKGKKNVLIDIKTTEDASPVGVSKAISKFDYLTQACIQIEGAVKSGYMDHVDHYFWLFWEKKSPFACQLYEFSREDIDRCMVTYKSTISRIGSAIECSDWPIYEEFAGNDQGILTAKIW